MKTKCFGISRNNSFTQPKIFLDSSTQTKKNFGFLNPNKKKYFWIPRPNNKTIIFLIPGHSSKWNKMFSWNSHPNKKYFFGFLNPNKKYFWISRPKHKKNIFGFLDPNKKKNILDSSDREKTIVFGPGRSPQGIFMTKSLLLFWAGRLFHQHQHQLKVGHGNETKCFGISRNNSFTQTKNIFLDSSTQTKKIFLDSSTQTKKNIFKFLDPNKKKMFLIPRPKQKKYF